MSKVCHHHLSEMHVNATYEHEGWLDGIADLRPDFKFLGTELVMKVKIVLYCSAEGWVALTSD